MKFRRKVTADEISGFLDQGTNVTGELQFSGTLRIDGNFHGSITTGDVLVIGEHAVVHADVTVGEIEVHGRVFGRIDAKRRVEIFSTGRVQGEIRCPVLSVQAGGIFDGRSAMSTDSDVNSPAPREATRVAKAGADSIHSSRSGRLDEI